MLTEGESDGVDRRVEVSFRGVDIVLPEGKMPDEEFVVGEVGDVEYAPALGAFEPDSIGLEVAFTGTPGVTTLLITEIMLAEMLGLGVGPPEMTKLVAELVAKLVVLTMTEELTIGDTVGPPEDTKPVTELVAKLVVLTMTEELMIGDEVGASERIRLVLDPVLELMTVTAVGARLVEFGKGLPEAILTVLKPVE